MEEAQEIREVAVVAKVEEGQARHTTTMATEVVGWVAVTNQTIVQKMTKESRCLSHTTLEKRQWTHLPQFWKMH